jgi:membrane protein YqaA with SNARE-associated domain
MKIFQTLYLRVFGWAQHRHAPRYLAALSFAESSVFPIPPDVLLAPMVLARPNNAWRYALLTTVASVLGGCLGYVLGVFLFSTVGEAIIEFYHAQAGFIMTQEWFERYGTWVILIAGFTPLPYKLFTISAGLVGMPLLPFIVASVVGRGARFFLVAGLIYWGGASLETFIRRYADGIGWGMVVLLVVIYFTVIA